MAACSSALMKVFSQPISAVGLSPVSPVIQNAVALVARTGMRVCARVIRRVLKLEWTKLFKTVFFQMVSAASSGISGPASTRSDMRL